MTKNIFNIKSNYNFLESLVHFILERYPDPFYLANVTIFLPSRRSCFEIKKIFLRQSSNQALILPKIKAIGDADYDDLNPIFFNDDDRKINYTPLSGLKYNLLLIDEIKKWNQTTNLFGKNTTIAQIAEIAANLKKFLEEVEKENLNLDNLKEVDDSDLANHKQQILKFLRHFGSNFQNVLSKNQISSAISYRNLMIRFSADYLNEHGSKYPIIAAGSTGTVSATAHLLKAIQNQPNGYLILFGLDKNLSAENLEIILESHPQFMLKKLLNFLNVDSSLVQDLDFEEFKLADDQITKLLSNLMLPASKTSEWMKMKDINEKAISNLTKIEAENNFDEARIISLIIRKNLEEKNKNIALITNDKNLALMVKINLQKWQINIDDSRNNNLIESRIVNYILALTEIFSNEFKSTNLLSILKHPLTKFGNEDKLYQRNLELLELKILRKVGNAGGFEYLKNKIFEFGDDELCNWFKKICEIFSPLQKLFLSQTISLKDLLIANIKCAEELSKNFDDEINLYNEEGASEFIEFSQELLTQSLNLNIENSSYNGLIGHLMQGYNFYTAQNFHPRLHILSTIEARLMNYDLMIISGLNEGEFPNLSSTEDWMARKMRLDFGLSDSSTKFGISAYDFCNYLSSKEVVITRSNNKNNSPTMESRFLMKLETFLRAINLKDKLSDGLYYKKLLSDSSEIINLQKITRPMPVPLRMYRPIKISATDIKKWLKDPYYIYAKRILNLKALNKIDQESSFAEFGNFVHKALENFIKNYSQIEPEKRLDELLNNYGKQAFQEYFPSQENKLLWWPKFENIANWFVKNEESINGNIKQTFTEFAAQMQIDGVTITTKIDRINIDENNEITILDYKTKTIPTNAEVKKGHEPQLAIEAVIIRDCMEAWHDYKIKNLQYYQLKGKDENKVEDLNETEKLIFEARQGMIKLITIFNDEKMPYTSCPDPDSYKEKKYNEYHHLSRIDEWW